MCVIIINSLYTFLDHCHPKILFQSDHWTKGQINLCWRLPLIFYSLNSIKSILQFKLATVKFNLVTVAACSYDPLFVFFAIHNFWFLMWNIFDQWPFADFIIDCGLSARTTYKRRAIYQFSGRLFRCIKYHPFVCSSLSNSSCDRPGLPAG